MKRPTAAPLPDPEYDGAAAANKRDRLSSGILLVAGLGLLLALPFVLRAGAGFILPLVAAMVLHLALARVADWLGAKGIPNSLASLLALAMMVALIVLAVALVVQPAFGLIDSLPEIASRLNQRIQVISGMFGRIMRAADDFSSMINKSGSRAVVLSSGGSIKDMLLQTPGVLLEGVLTLLLTYFMLEARLRVRRHILVEREDFAGSLRAAAVLREMQSQIGTYFITNISVAGVIGIIVSAGAWAFGWDMPLMWGGLAAIFNLLPYIGPLTMIALLALFGLGSDAPLGWAIAPMICYGVLHATEANVVTPIILGKRLAVSPVAILASLIFFSWVWGVAGALLAAPLLLILSVMLDYVGRPNLIGFLLGEPLISEPKISAGARTGSETAA